MNAEILDHSGVNSLFYESLKDNRRTLYVDDMTQADYLLMTLRRCISLRHHEKLTRWFSSNDDKILIQFFDRNAL